MTAALLFPGIYELETACLPSGNERRGDGKALQSRCLSSTSHDFTRLHHSDFIFQLALRIYLQEGSWK